MFSFFSNKRRLADLECQVENLTLIVEKLQSKNKKIEESTFIKTGSRKPTIIEKFQYFGRIRKVPILTPIDEVLGMIIQKLNIEFEHTQEETITKQATITIKKKDRSNRK